METIGRERLRRILHISSHLLEALGSTPMAGVLGPQGRREEETGLSESTGIL